MARHAKICTLSKSDRRFATRSSLFNTHLEKRFQAKLILNKRARCYYGPRL